MRFSLVMSWHSYVSLKKLAVSSPVIRFGIPKKTNNNKKEVYVRKIIFDFFPNMCMVGITRIK